jgi:hypothetical protein
VAAGDRTLPSRRSDRTLVWLLLAAAAVASAAAWAFREGRTARGLVEREDAALAAMDRVAAAEAVHLRERGAYGVLGDLDEAGLLDAVAVARGPDGAHVRTPGYRLDVLLPGKGVALVAPGGVPETEAARRRYAVVARPVRPGVTGFRSLYRDERGETWATEGAVDPEALRTTALPDRRVLGESGSVAVGGSWHRVTSRPSTSP